MFNLQLRRFEYDEVELDIEVSKGTYIRNIIDDLGQMLGCGAHVTLLRRTFVADYPVDAMVSLEQLQQDKEDGLNLDEYLLPMDSPIMHFEEAIIDDESEHHFCHGQAIMYPNLEEGELIRVYNEADEFLGLAEVDKELMLAPKRLVVRQVT